VLIETALFRLLHHSSITGLVGSSIFPGVAPQKTETGIVYWSPEAGREVVDTLEGGSTLVRDRFHISSYAKGFGNYGVAAAMDTAIFNRLNEFGGDVQDLESPPNILTIQRIFAMESPQHAYNGFSDRTEHHRFTSGFEIVYSLERKVLSPV